MALLQNINDLNLILIMIYCFVDDFLKGIVNNIKYALARPGKNRPPIKKRNLSLAELASLAIFRFFAGHGNWKDFHQRIKTYHKQDFSNLPNYQNFPEAINKLSFLATVMLQGFMNIFNRMTGKNGLKFTDSTKLKICEIKREFSHKVCFGLASKSKSSMGWFYGFKLHIIRNELLQILKLRQLVETVYSILKLRMGLETTLPRSPLGYFAHYIWCITAYQLKKFLELLFNKPKLA